MRLLPLYKALHFAVTLLLTLHFSVLGHSLPDGSGNPVTPLEAAEVSKWTFIQYYEKELHLFMAARRDIRAPTKCGFKKRG